MHMLVSTNGVNVYGESTYTKIREIFGDDGTKSPHNELGRSKIHLVTKATI